MPCRDFYDDNPQAYYGPMLKDKDKEIERLKKQVSFAESALCAALNSIQEWIVHISDATATDYIDYEAAGINKKELVRWWKKHKELDAKHRAEEAEKLEKKRIAEEDKRRKDEARKAALAKLTDEERKLLGVDRIVTKQDYDI